MKIFYFMCGAFLLSMPSFAQETTATDESVINAEGLLGTDVAENADISAKASEQPAQNAVEPAVDLLNATADGAKENAEPREVQLLPSDFEEKMLSCTPDKTMRKVSGVTENIEVLGEENGKCHIKMMIFSLNVPFERLAEVKSFEDLENLCKEPEIATLEYKENYHYINLMSELNMCADFQALHHNGRTSNEYPFLNVTVMTDMTAQHKDDSCELTLVNEVTMDNKFMNYNVVCVIPDGKISQLLEPYGDLLDLYGAKEIEHEDGTISSRPAAVNDYTRRVDAKLMYQLQIDGYCRLATEKEQ